jgi:hypothetical protein
VHSAAPAGLGRPRGPHRADPAPASEAAKPPPGHAPHYAPVAPPPGHQEAGLSEPDWPAAGQAVITALIERLATENHGWRYG